MAASTDGSSVNCRTVANRTARNIRSGSSSKVVCGSSGVTIRRAFRSERPRPVRSSTVPSQSISSALIVKSRRMTSSFSVPGLTSGFRLARSYRSTRLDTNSRAWSSRSRCAVPNRSKMNGGCSFKAALTAVASSIAPWPSTRMSTSRIWLARSPPSRRSRTYPPTTRARSRRCRDCSWTAAKAGPHSGSAGGSSRAGMPGAKPRELDRADQSRIITQRRRDDAQAPARGLPGRGVHRPPHRPEQWGAGLEDTSPEHDQLRIEKVDERTHGDPEVGTGVLEDGLCQRIPRAGGAGHVLGPRPRQSVEHAARRSRRQLPCHAGNPGPAGDRLHTTPIAAGAERAVALHHDVADLTRDSVRPGVELAAQHQPGADAGGHGHIDHLAGATGRAPLVLAEGGKVRVVVKEAGDAGCPGQNPVEGHVLETGQVGGTDDEARRRVDRSG